MGESAVLPQTLANRMESAAGLRNILVHMYAKIEPDKLYNNLQNDIEDMELFIEYIASYLAKKLN